MDKKHNCQEYVVTFKDFNVIMNNFILTKKYSHHIWLATAGVVHIFVQVCFSERITNNIICSYANDQNFLLISSILLYLD